ncbi:MAG: hypothetical protein AAB510_03425 [Patescibacteria group bacterium]
MPGENIETNHGWLKNNAETELITLAREKGYEMKYGKNEQDAFTVTLTKPNNIDIAGKGANALLACEDALELLREETTS